MSLSKKLRNSNWDTEVGQSRSVRECVAMDGRLRAEQLQGRADRTVLLQFAVTVPCGSRRFLDRATDRQSARLCALPIIVFRSPPSFADCPFVFSKVVLTKFEPAIAQPRDDMPANHGFPTRRSLQRRASSKRIRRCEPT
jgi:hypothetical protein